METKKVVVTKEGVRLDEIVFQEHGHLKYFEEILEMNIKKIRQQTHLPQGIELMLPMYNNEETNEVEASKLW